ncbi:MAG: PIN domain-containing protein [Actinomycetota bacterium]|nr:PIN domain-containing protein [Actinomycetota bacterium]
MAFPALLDTCVLFPQYLSDTLLTQAYEGTFRPLWSRGVLDELGRVFARKTQMTEQQIEHRLDRMRRAFPDAEVEGYEYLIDGMTNHEKDRHVLAAAVRGNVEVLVTFNLKDFPESALKPFDISAVHPDDFLLDQLDLYPGVVLGCLENQVDRYTAINGPMAIVELLRPLESAGVPRFADEVRRHLQRS